MQEALLQHFFSATTKPMGGNGPLDYSTRRVQAGQLVCMSLQEIMQSDWYGHSNSYSTYSYLPPPQDTLSKNIRIHSGLSRCQLD